MSVRKVIIEHNPYDTLVLVFVGGVVVASTASEDDYLGLSEAEASCAVGSVMRYKLGREAGADGYSSTINVPLPPARIEAAIGSTLDAGTADEIPTEVAECPICNAPTEWVRIEGDGGYKPTLCGECFGDEIHETGGGGSPPCGICGGSGRMVVEIEEDGQTVQGSQPCSHCGGERSEAPPAGES